MIFHHFFKFILKKTLFDEEIKHGKDAFIMDGQYGHKDTTISEMVNDDDNNVQTLGNNSTGIANDNS